jgi:sensor c-di-GMP phosphodiesterase-like protein
MRKFLLISTIAIISSFSSYSQSTCEEQHLDDMRMNRLYYDLSILACNNQLGYSTTAGVNCRTMAMREYSAHEEDSYSAWKNCMYPISIERKMKRRANRNYREFIEQELCIARPEFIMDVKLSLNSLKLTTI